MHCGDGQAAVGECREVGLAGAGRADRDRVRTGISGPIVKAEVGVIGSGIVTGGEGDGKPVPRQLCDMGRGRSRGGSCVDLEFTGKRRPVERKQPAESVEPAAIRGRARPHRGERAEPYGRDIDELLVPRSRLVDLKIRTERKTGGGADDTSANAGAGAVEPVLVLPGDGVVAVSERGCRWQPLLSRMRRGAGDPEGRRERRPTCVIKPSHDVVDAVAIRIEPAVEDGIVVLPYRHIRGGMGPRVGRDLGVGLVEGRVGRERQGANFGRCGLIQ